MTSGRTKRLGHDSVVSCDNVATVPTSTLRRKVGHLLPEAEAELAKPLGRRAQKKAGHA